MYSKCMTVYIDSRISPEWNANFNPELCKALEEQGINCYLPQRDTNQDGSREERFHQNIEGIKKSDIVLAVAFDESPNWGVEIGYAYGIKKKIVILKSKKHTIPLMAEYMANKVMVVEDLEKIHTYIDDLIEALTANK